MRRLQAAFAGRDVPADHVAKLARTLHIFPQQMQPWFDGLALQRSRQAKRASHAPPPQLREVFVPCVSCGTLWNAALCGREDRKQFELHLRPRG